MKKVCERETHQRLGWLLFGVLAVGVSLGQMVGGASVVATVPASLIALFGFGVHVGVIKLDKPKKAPKEAPKEPKSETT